MQPSDWKVSASTTCTTVYPALLKYNYTVSLIDIWHSSSYTAKTETCLCRKSHTVAEYITSKRD
jgi:hypothetical protein